MIKTSQITSIFRHFQLVAALTFSLVLTTLNTPAEALTFTSPEVAFLNSQMTANQNDNSILNSYQGTSSQYTYDYALAIIVFSHAKEKQLARRLLIALKKQQSLDGSWPFKLNETSKISGAIAWAVLAANTYQKHFKSTEFEPMALKALRYLKQNISQQQPYAVRFSNTSDIISIEHQIDTLAALDSLDLKHQSEFSSLRKNILKTLKNHWVGYRFLAGSDSKTEIKNKSDMYEDVNSWSYLVLSHLQDAEFGFIQDLDQGLQFNCTKFLRTVTKANQTYTGFLESNHHLQTQKTDFIWLEGTYGMISALQLWEKNHNQASDCSGLTARDLELQLSSIQNADGGVPYATVAIDQQFSNLPSVASTAWLYFVKNKINPFLP
jgi:hypothetical protein